MEVGSTWIHRASNKRGTIKYIHDLVYEIRVPMAIHFTAVESQNWRHYGKIGK